MGIIQTIKNKLGIGGVKVNLQAPAQVSKNDLKAAGTITLTSKSEQSIVSIKVKVIEEYTKGRGDDKTTKEFTLGSLNLPANFTIKAGETKSIPYSIDFELLKSSNDELKEKGGALGAVGSLAKFASNEKSAYFVEVEVDVKSAVLDPSDKKEFKLV